MGHIPKPARGNAPLSGAECATILRHFYDTNGPQFTARKSLRAKKYRAPALEGKKICPLSSTGYGGRYVIAERDVIILFFPYSVDANKEYGDDGLG
jgi:hypothetical protein